MNASSNLKDECQRIGCRLDGTDNDLFEHLSYHRTLLLDHLSNIAHEIGPVGRKITNKDLGIPALTTSSQQDIAPQKYSIRNAYNMITTIMTQLPHFFKNIASLFKETALKIFSWGKPVQPSTLLGGMNSNRPVPHDCISLATYNGMQFSNPKNDCYLNSAVNNILTNVSMRQAIQNQSLQHSHSHQLIINELRKLMSSAESVKSVKPLKEALKLCYPQVRSYSNDEQQDAGQAFFDIVQCLPNVEDSFKILIKTIRTCSNQTCQHQDGSTKIDNYINLSTIHLKSRGLQQIINEWRSHRETIKKRCISASCPTRHRNGQIVQNLQEMPDIEHEEKSIVIGAPSLLYIKLRDLRAPRLDIDMVESFHLNGVPYILQSVMIHTGTGLRGHWRSLIKEPSGYVLYNDTAEPILLLPSALKNILKEGTEFIYFRVFPPTDVSSMNEINDKPFEPAPQNDATPMEVDSAVTRELGEKQLLTTDTTQHKKSEHNLAPTASDISDNVPVKLKKGEKLLQMCDLREYIQNAQQSITILDVKPNDETSTTTSTGPWVYRNKKNTWVHYSTTTNDIEEQCKILLQNLFTRGFPKQGDTSKINKTPVKRKTEDTLLSPLKKLILNDCSCDKENTISTPNKNCPMVTHEITPNKREIRVVVKRLDSPIVKNNLLDENSADGSFKVPVEPILNNPSNVKGSKLLYLNEIKSHIMKSSQTITFERVESDIQPTADNASGPWHFKDSKKVFVHYKVIVNDTIYSNKIMLPH